MNNFQLIKGFICGISIVTAAVSCQKKEQKPNIFILLADDQRADAIGCSGNQQIKTPNIDRLAANGLRFTNSYVMGGHHGAISAPSRAMLLSGMNLFNVYDKLEGVKTIIVYAADNGLAIGSHGLLGKQNLYEHSMKVPLIITGPGIPEGKVSDALVYLFDLYPTLAEFCSLPSPEGIDGKTLVPVISGQSDEVRSSLFTVYRTTVRAVRTKEWKLIRYPERDYTQLFDLVNDPLELNNLAGVDGNNPRIEDLMKLMREWQENVNDTLPLTAERILPLKYDHTRLVRKPDRWQPEYTLRKYFREN